MTEPVNPHDPERKPPENFTQQGIQHTPIGARIPEEVGRGAFCNATMILQSHDEFVIDFLGTIAQPQQLVARVILTPTTFNQLIAALRENLGIFESHFGKLAAREPVPSNLPPVTPAGASQAVVNPGQPGSPGNPALAEIPQEMPSSPGPRPPSPPTIEDLYDQLKLSDKMLAGVYANMVMIRHMNEEFCLDFVANFYPRSVVTARIFMAAGRIPSLLSAMIDAMNAYRQRLSGG